ncbi:hypothetical protein D3C86_1660670 [compost metagenome]
MRQQAADPGVQRQPRRHDQRSDQGRGGDVGQPRRHRDRHDPHQTPPLRPAHQNKGQPVGRHGRMQEGRDESPAQQGNQDGLLEIGRGHSGPFILLLCNGREPD